MIEKETIDKIFDAANIVEVVSDFVSLKKRGVNFLGNCPFHNEKTPSFTVSPAKGIYKCFGCGKGGNSVNFIMEHEQLNYTDTLKWLAKKYHIEVVEKETTPEQKEQADNRESLMILSGYAQKAFAQNLHETEEGNAVGLAYFKERGFTLKTIKKFELGYCRKGFDVFTKQALAKGYKENFLIETGLTVKRDDGSYYDRFNERVIFPIHNLMGRTIAFGGRTLRTDKNVAKYLNSPESEIYHKSKVLYGIYFAKQSIIQNNKCFLVEGYTDVLSMHQAGIENVVASSGTALTVEQIRLIRRFTPNVTVLYDGDAAGIKAAFKGINMVLEEGMNVKVVLLPDGEDPDSFARKQNATSFYEFIHANETDFISFKTKLLLSEVENDPVKKSNLILDIVRTIAVIPDSIIRALYIKECSTLMQVDEKILYAEINKIIIKSREQRWQIEKSTPPNPLGEALNVQFSVSDKYKLYEKEIVRLLLNYPNKVLFKISATEDQPDVDITAAEYIFRELEHEIDFQTPEYKIILDEFKLEWDKGTMIDGSYFIHHENQLVSRVTAGLVAEGPQISKMWSKKGTYVNTEEDNLKKVIDNAIAGYKYELVLNILTALEKELKLLSAQPDQDAIIQELYEKYMAFTQFKIDVSKALGERIILKR